MSQICQRCGKGPTVGATRSHSHIQSKRWIGVNLQYKKIDNKRMRICTSCIKTLAKKAN